MTSQWPTGRWIGQRTLPLLLAVVLWQATPSFAVGITLHDAITQALAHNPDLHAVKQQLYAASAEAEVSQGAALPTLTLSHTARYSDNPLDAFADKLNTRQVTTADFAPSLLNHPNASDVYWTQLALRYPLYTGGRIAAEVESAERTSQYAQLQYQRAREQTAFAVISAYLGAQAAAQALVIAEDAVQAAAQHANTTVKLAGEGRIVESDKLAAAVNLAALRAQREQAATKYKSALDGLKLVIGMALHATLELAAIDVMHEMSDDDIGVLQQRALHTRKDVAAASARVQAASAGVVAARAVNKPSIDLVASSNWYDDAPGLENNSSSIMGVLSFNLYDAKTAGQIDSRLAVQRQHQWQLQALEQAVQKQVREAYDSFVESTNRLALAEQNVDTAKQTVSLVKQRYGQGRTILLDLLQAERLYTDARIEKLTAKLHLDVARYALPLAMGTLVLPSEVAP
jgi:outer membrane protein TolC